MPRRFLRPQPRRPRGSQLGDKGAKGAGGGGEGKRGPGRPPKNENAAAAAAAGKRRRISEDEEYYEEEKAADEHMSSQYCAQRLEPCTNTLALPVANPVFEPSRVRQVWWGRWGWAALAEGVQRWWWYRRLG